MQAGIVRVVAWQQAPRCRLEGRYFMRANRGAANVLRLPRRIGKHALHAGTYRFFATFRGNEVLDVRVRLVRTKKAFRIRHDNLVDLCPTTTALTAAVGSPASGQSVAAGPPSAALEPPSTRASSHPFLPPVIRDLNPANASPLVRAILFALLGCAIALLAAASLPERALVGPTGGGVVSRHRAAITLAGLALIAVAILVTRVG